MRLLGQAAIYNALIRYPRSVPPLNVYVVPRFVEMPVKNAFLTIRSWTLAAVFAVLPAAPAWAQNATTSVARADKTVSVDAKAREAAATRRNKALDTAISGDLDAAMGQIKAALKLNPKDRAARKAMDLIRVQKARLDKAHKQRIEEYRTAVDRVRRAMLADAHMPAMKESGLFKKLNDAIMERAVSTYNNTATVDQLEEAKPAKAAELRTQSVKALSETLEALEAAVEALEDRQSDYAKEFRATAKALRAELTRYRKAWERLETDKPGPIARGARALRGIEDDLSEAMADLETLAVEEPWRVALMQARVAAELAVDRDRMRKQDWYRTLVTETETHGAEAVADYEWSEALRVYANLEELDKSKDVYHRKRKDAERHVRVLRLYGVEDEDSATQPATKDDSDEEPAWKKRVEGVDADMVTRIIGQVDRAYVTRVDYRTITRGALRALRTLAETPQAAHTFEGLKNDAKRKEFIRLLARELEHVQRKDSVDYLDLHLALNGALSASERTVKIPTEVLAVEFADGFLNELDKFSSMIWPSEVQDFIKSTMGHFFGVGIQISKEPGEPLKVVSPLLNSPAQKAGIKANDLIVAVDDRRTADLPIDKLVKNIMGPKGTDVVLTIRRQGVLKPFDVTVTRDEIHIQTVKGWRRKRNGEWDFLVDPEGRIGYIRVTQFTEKTVLDVTNALSALNTAGVENIILDMRFNPGGLLPAAANVADHFLRNGTIVSTKGLQVRPQELRAGPNGKYLRGNLVVLVNEYSASAAEIVSGAMKDWRRATILGERTYGKGSVQNVISVRHGKARLKLTTAYYYLPSGRLLHRKNRSKVWGVDPDVEIFMTPRQAKRWLDIRRKTDLLDTEVEPEELAADLEGQYEADFQLSTAVLLLKLMSLRSAEMAA